MTKMSFLHLFGIQCAPEENPTFLPSGVQFGLSRHSHMTFIIKPRTARKRSVSMTPWLAWARWKSVADCIFVSNYLILL